MTDKFRFTGLWTPEDYPSWFTTHIDHNNVLYGKNHATNEPFLQIHTPLGCITAWFGDWVVLGDKGQVKVLDESMKEVPYNIFGPRRKD